MQGKLGKEKKTVECRRQARLLRYLVMNVLFSGSSGYLSSKTDFSRANRNCQLGHTIISFEQIKCTYSTFSLLQAVRCATCQQI
eukprot:scaffold196164_cov32-Prasinocladus_malaysianus.AAC.1